MRIVSRIASLAALGLGLVAIVYLGWSWQRDRAEPTDVAPVDAGPSAPPRAMPSRSAARARDPRPNILLFTIDTVRADHLTSYGYPRDTSPTMDALAARGTRFTRAYATCSWTLPSVASIVTGVLPSEHGVTHSGVASVALAEQDMLSASLPNIAALLHDAGYRTVAVTTNTHLLGQTGFSRGFDDYECVDFPTTQQAHVPIWSRLDALRTSDAPYFFWIHLTDPHVIYQAREPQFSRWWPASRGRHPILDQAIYMTGIRPAAVAQGVSIDEALEYAMAQYDSEIRATDDFLDELLGELDDGHLAVVLTSDHGEEFNEHGQMGHGTTLFDDVARVPLIVALPGQSPSVVTTPVTLLDVFPTIAEISSTPIASAAGISLVIATRGEPVPARDIVMESGRRFPVQAIVDERYKYGELLPPAHLQALFDLENDPQELHECLAEHPEIASAMRERLHATLDAARARRPETTVAHIEIPEELREHLRALGYGD